MVTVTIIIVKGFMRSLPGCEEGGMVEFIFQENKVEFQLPDCAESDEWEISPQQSPCEVCQ